MPWTASETTRCSLLHRSKQALAQRPSRSHVHSYTHPYSQSLQLIRKNNNSSFDTTDNDFDLAGPSSNSNHTHRLNLISISDLGLSWPLETQDIESPLLCGNINLPSPPCRIQPAPVLGPYSSRSLEPPYSAQVDPITHCATPPPCRDPPPAKVHLTVRDHWPAHTHSVNRLHSTLLGPVDHCKRTNVYLAPKPSQQSDANTFKHWHDGGSFGEGQTGRQSQQWRIQGQIQSPDASSVKNRSVLLHPHHPLTRLDSVISSRDRYGLTIS